MAVEVISTYTADDTLPVLSRNYDSGNTDITGWTITLRIERPGQPVLEKIAAIVDGPAGDFSFTFASGDLVKGDGQVAEIEYEPDTGGNFTEGDLIFNVAEELG